MAFIFNSALQLQFSVWFSCSSFTSFSHNRSQWYLLTQVHGHNIHRLSTVCTALSTASGSLLYQLSAPCPPWGTSLASTCRADREESLLTQRWILIIFQTRTLNTQQYKYNVLLECSIQFRREFISSISLVPTITSCTQQQCKLLKWQHSLSVCLHKEQYSIL